MISIRLKAQEYLPDVSILANKTHAERIFILSPFYELGLVNLDSISIFSKIEEVRYLAKSKSDKDLALEAEVMDAHYYYYRDEIFKELVVDKLITLDSIAKKQKILWLEIRVQNMLANYFYSHRKDYAKGFEYFERTGQLLENVSTEEFPLKQICLYQVGVAYIEFKQYDDAISYLVRASNEESKNTRYYYKPTINNTLGISYRELNNIDSSDYYFKKAIKFAQAKNDSVWIGIINGNLGYNRFLDKEYDKAKELISIDLAQALKTNEYGLASNAYMMLAKIAFHEEYMDRANVLAKKAKTYAYRSNELHRLKDLYPLLAKIKALTNEPKLTAIYIDSAAIIKDSLLKIFDTRILTRAKQKVKLQEVRAEKQRDQQLAERQIFRRNLIIGIMISVFIISLLLYNRYRLKVKNRQQRTENQKEKALHKLKMASEQLNAFKTSIVHKNAMLEMVKSELVSKNEEIQILKATSEEIIKINTKETSLNKLQQSILLTDKDWRDFVALFESVYPNFFKNLKIAYPTISTAETRVMALLKLGLENKEMALMLGVGTSAIRQIKSRLRKKLSISVDTNFSDLIADI